MAEYELAIRARRAVTPEGVRPVTVAVRAGRIAAMAGFSDRPDAAHTEDHIAAVFEVMRFLIAGDDGGVCHLE